MKFEYQFGGWIVKRIKDCVANFFATEDFSNPPIGLIIL